MQVGDLVKYKNTKGGLVGAIIDLKKDPTIGSILIVRWGDGATLEYEIHQRRWLEVIYECR